MQANIKCFDAFASALVTSLQDKILQVKAESKSTDLIASSPY